MIEAVPTTLKAKKVKATITQPQPLNIWSISEGVKAIMRFPAILLRKRR